MTLTFTSLSDKGCHRKENQDNLYCDGIYRRDISNQSAFRAAAVMKAPALFAVADGMGGEANGAATAFEAVKTLDKLPQPVTAQHLVEHIMDANRSVCQMIADAGGIRMGTTFVGLSIHSDLAQIVNIGDSRAYLFRDSALVQLTVDHTGVRPLVEAGILTLEQAKGHPDAHRLTQHIGIFPQELLIAPHTSQLSVQAGDLFLLCSDGLTDGLDDSAIADILSQRLPLREKLNTLYSEALKGSKDNITVILVEIQ